ncbi:alpha/beta hydrolase [Streptomyces nigra]
MRISPASWSAPDLDDWVDAVQEAYQDASKQDGHVALAAHTLAA